MRERMSVGIGSTVVSKERERERHTHREREGEREEREREKKKNTDHSAKSLIIIKLSKKHEKKSDQSYCVKGHEMILKYQKARKENPRRSKPPNQKVQVTHRKS